MTKTREEILENRRRLRAEYRELFDSTASLLFRYDPIGIGIDVNKDEYETEVGTILPRLGDCHSADDVLQVVHEEFVRWFDSGTVGSKDRYREIAGELWQLWQGFRDGPKIPLSQGET